MRNKFWILLLIVSSLFWVFDVWAHGEDQPGPNGGYIRMPGAFHTEIVPVSKNQVKLYLLDLEWKNPSVKKAKTILKVGSKKKPASCKPLENKYFLCTFSVGVDLTLKNTLYVEAEREGQKGQKVKYDLPLRLGLNASEAHPH